MMLDVFATRLLIFFAVVNALAFFVMLLDKLHARRTGSDRISEGKMFFLASMFGSLGIYAGMFAFRHKTRKWHFIIGIPLLFVQNVATLYLVYQLVVKNVFVD